MGFLEDDLDEGLKQEREAGRLPNLGQRSQLDRGPMAFPPDAKGEFIFTFTGRKLYFDDPAPAISIIDIAHALSQLCRWTGHTMHFYSIAQHCVLCSYYPFNVFVSQSSKGLTDVPRFALRKLLHDAAEAYVNDLNKPLKNLIGEQYDTIEGRIETAIYKKYGLSPTMDQGEREEVKEADLAVAFTEARDLLHQNSTTKYRGAKPLKEKITGWSPTEAESKFLDRFQELM